MILKPKRKLWTPPRNMVMPRSWYRQRGFFTPMAMHKPFTVGAVDLDGTNDYMTRGAGFTGATDSKLGTFSAWVRIDGGNATARSIVEGDVTLGGSNIRFGAGMSSGNKFELDLVGATGTTLLIMLSTNSFTAGAAWHHFLASWNLGTLCRMYIDDVSEGSAIGGNEVADYTLGDWAVGASSAGTFKFNGAIAEVLFLPGVFFDLTVEANRRKFRLANGKPANLGPTGNYPTGAASLMYQHLRRGEAVANFAANRGTGGDLTITGSLDTASTSPSD